MTTATGKRLDRIELALPGDTLLLSGASPTETAADCLGRHGIKEAVGPWRKVVIVDTGVYR
jgi:hypothetical protein